MSSLEYFESLSHVQNMKKAAKKTSKKTAKKISKKTPKKAANMELLNPTLYVHATDKGPQLCIKTAGRGPDGVVLPKEVQKELDTLHKEWSKQTGETDFLESPKAKKWVKKLLSSYSLSKIPSKAPKKKKK